MELTRWNPWRELEDMTNRLNTLFRARDDERAPHRSFVADWNPAVDIKENEEEYLITAELPGVDKKDVKVSLKNDVLVIEGTKKAEKKEEKETFHRVERFHGTFYRSFLLPEGTDEEKIQARFSEGILTVNVPKAQVSPVRSKEVPVS